MPWTHGRWFTVYLHHYWRQREFNSLVPFACHLAICVSLRRLIPPLPLPTPLLTFEDGRSRRGASVLVPAGFLVSFFSSLLDLEKRMSQRSWRLNSRHAQRQPKQMKPRTVQLMISRISDKAMSSHCPKFCSPRHPLAAGTSVFVCWPPFAVVSAVLLLSSSSSPPPSSLRASLLGACFG